MTPIQQTDRAILGLIAVVLVITVGIYLWSTEYFRLAYAAEDGLVEYGTALFLLVASVILATHARALWRQKRRGAAFLMLFYALLFFAGAGEEVSWGQRIFGWQSGEFFQENNKQLETNFHNLVVGEVHLAKTLFGSVLTAVILLYLVVLPLLYPRVEAIRRLADRFVVPVPGLRHGILAIAASLVIAAIDVNRKWEVYELVFSLLVVSIFLLPQNRNKIT